MRGRFLARLRAWFHPDRVEREIDEELRFHLDRQIEDFVRAGMTPAAARAAALRAFGGLEPSKEACRDARGLRLLNELRQDARYAARMLRKNATLTAVVTLTLAISIGGNTALFSVVDAVLLKPLGFPEADRLVMIGQRTESHPQRAVSLPDFLDWQARQQTFDDMAAGIVIGGVLTGGGDPERVFGRAVTRNFFSTLGAPLALGRTFTGDEDQPGGARAIILSYPLWQRRYGGDPTVIGRAVGYNAESHTVIGIAPKDFDYYGRSNLNNDIFLPLGHLAGQPYMQQRDSHPLLAVGRMKRGVTIDTAHADLAAIQAALEAEHPATNKGVGVRTQSLLNDYVGDVRLALSVLMGASCLLLTIACVNVANLLLARASTRRQEIAVRLAVGAGRGRIVRQLLTESLLLAAIGGAAGLGLAWAATGWIVRLAPVALPRVEETTLDWRIAAFAAAVTIVTGLAFGIAPAVQTADVQLQQLMRAGGRGIAGIGSRLRAALVAAEIALCVALLIGTGLLLRSFDQLRRLDPGFQPERVVTMRLRLPDARYRDRQHVLAVLENVLARVSALPGVESAALTTGVPLGRSSLTRFTLPGLEPSTPDRAPLAVTQSVSEAYHRTFGVALRAGRYFTAADRAGSADVAIVDTQFARTYFPGTDPSGAIGRRVNLAGRWREIVGVVSHVNHRLEEPPSVQIYVPFAQAEPGWQLEVGRAMDIAVKSATAPDTIVAAVRKEMQAIDREAPLSHITTMTGAVSRAMAPRVFNLVLLALFAGSALLLCVVGIYGVISYSVAQRTSEIGMRMTLGAQRSDVLTLVLTEGLRMAAAGVAAGVFGALLLGRLVEGLLFGVRPADPVTYAAVVLILIVVAALASFIPARRATTMDLVSAVRGD
jgi:putative ABC transport system permease protein